MTAAGDTLVPQPGRSGHRDDSQDNSEMMERLHDETTNPTEQFLCCKILADRKNGRFQDLHIAETVRVYSAKFPEISIAPAGVCCPIMSPVFIAVLKKSTFLHIKYLGNLLGSKIQDFAK